MQATLDTAAIDAVPIDTDWSEGWGERWEHWDPPMDGVTFDHGSGEWLDADGEPCGSYGEGPMMNYRYPLPAISRLWEPYDAAAKLVGLPVCYVEWDGEPCLALTGGGMDLSWEICEAYIRLGYLPPAHFASDLPKYSGLTPDPATLAACRESLAITAQRAEGRLARFDADWS